jgi:outer membrane protein OmpA-like peptidoglycan-associated protein
MPVSSLASETKKTAVPKNRAAINPASPVPLESVRQNLSSLTSAPLIQPKLKIGAANDKYEREADRVADLVMRMPEGKAAASGSSVSSMPSGNTVQCSCAGCQQKLEEINTLQAKVSPGHTPAVTPNVASGIQSLNGRGQPLPASSRGYFEPRFGHDFSRVRIHVDKRAAGMADSIGAKAFTLGQDVVFGEGRYQPDSREGRRLIAHELAHTIQQGKVSENTPDAICLSSVDGDRIQKDDDDDEERRRRRGGFWSNWRLQIGAGPMRAPSPSGPAADFYPPTEQLPLPGFLLNRGLGFQYSVEGLDFGVFPNLGGSTDFYGTRDIPRLLNPGSSQQQTPATPQPGIPIPGQTPPISPNVTIPSAPVHSPVPGTGVTPMVPLRGLRERTIDRFVLNQSTLPSNAAAELDSMAVWIRFARPAIVWVTGHTDISGGEQHNQQLSEDRAASVRQALIDRGIDGSIIETAGEGEMNPSVPDATTRDQHARNRRVTVEWFDAVPPAPSFRLRSPWLESQR